MGDQFNPPLQGPLELPFLDGAYLLQAPQLIGYRHPGQVTSKRFIRHVGDIGSQVDILTQPVLIVLQRRVIHCL